MFSLPLIWAAALLLISAAHPALGADVGVAIAEGVFLLNNAQVRGNATLAEGAAVETSRVESELRLRGGARFVLDRNSRARVYGDHLVLERGSGELSTEGSYAVEATTLRISAQPARARARILLREGKAVQVAALAGRFWVHSRSGVLVSNVAPGLALEFEPQVTGPGAPSSFVGCVLKKDNKFIVYDQTTRMEVELRGTGLDREWGNIAQVNGTTRAAGPQATVQILDVTSVTRLETGGCQDIAAAIGAQAPGAAPAPPAAATAKPATAAPQAPKPAARTGMSAGAKVAIVALVGAGGAAGAVVATQSGDNRSR